MGRTSKYESTVKPKIPLIEAWCRDGATDEIIAEKLEIALSTFYEYKKKYPEFSEALKKGKEIVDVEVENALLKKSLGFVQRIEKAFKCKNVIYNEQGKKVKEEEIIKTAYEDCYIPPDTTAQIFWLKNRKPTVWRDKQDKNNEDALNKLDKLLEAQKNA